MIRKFHLVLQFQSARHDLRRFPRARQRARQDDVERDLHLPQRVRQLFGSLDALWRERTFVFLVGRIAVFDGVAVSQNIKLHEPVLRVVFAAVARMLAGRKPRTSSILFRKESIARSRRCNNSVRKCFAARSASSPWFTAPSSRASNTTRS